MTAKLYAFRDWAVDRFKEFDERAQREDRDILKRFENLYSFLGQIVQVQEAVKEKTYVFAKALRSRLPRWDPWSVSRKERFGLNLSEADQLLFDQFREEWVQNPHLQNQAKANPIENFKFGFDKVSTRRSSSVWA